MLLRAVLLLLAALSALTASGFAATVITASPQAAKQRPIVGEFLLRFSVYCEAFRRSFRRAEPGAVALAGK